MNIFFKCLYGLVKGIYYGLYNVKVEGRENIPEKSGFIIASNHRTFADPPLIAVTAGCAKYSFVAKAELFRFPPFGWLIRKLGGVSGSKGKRRHEGHFRFCRKNKSRKKSCYFSGRNKK